jgi:pimeloyl-ACP methyl ester carboxylesterase
LLDVDGASHRFVELPGLRVHLAEAGHGDPVVLLHTVFEHWYAWRHVVPRLAMRYRVICPDLRGCGWTDAPPRGYEKESLASDVVRLLDALGLDRVRLVGHSLGGLVAFLVALRHPRRVDQLMVVGVTHPWPRPAPLLRRLHRNWYQLLVAAPALGPWMLAKRPQLTRWVLRGTSPSPEAWPDDVVNAFASRLTDPSRALAVSRMYRTLLLRELLPLLRGRYRGLSLEPPALLLLGAKDYFFPTSALAGYEPFARRLRVDVVAEAGHFIPEENPALFCERVLEFFEEGA